MIQKKNNIQYKIKLMENIQQYEYNLNKLQTMNINMCWRQFISFLHSLAAGPFAAPLHPCRRCQSSGDV
jgi:hypothetical protein